MHRFRRVGSAMIIVFILLGLTVPASRSDAAPPIVPPVQGSFTTPFQKALADALSQRQAAGLPVPDVTASQQVAGSPMLAPGDAVGSFSVTTTTILVFAGPEEAGYESWPEWTLDERWKPSGALGAGGYIEPIKAAVEAQHPAFWDQYEFGYEPRTYIFTETLGPSVPRAPALVPAGAVTTTEAALMGFTYNGLYWPYYIEQTLTIAGLPVAYFKAGFDLGWGFGLRLPVEVSLTGPATVAAGDTYRPSAVLTPLDWSADDYTAAGVAPHDGNEYVFWFEFFIGVTGNIGPLPICPQPPCPPTSWELSLDQSASFVTPLGPGSAFPVGTIPIPVWDYTLNLPPGIPLPFDPVFAFAITLNITPQLGSSGITADWRALPSSGATGSGTVTFNSAGTPVELGTVTVTNPDAGSAIDVELSNFQYWFDQFLVELSAEVSFELFGYGVWNPVYPIYTFDLSALTQITGLSSLAVGRHTECTWDFVCGPSGPDNVLVVSSLVGGPGSGSASVAPPGPPVPLCADLDGSTTETIRAHVPPGTVTNGSVFCRSLVENSVFVQDSAEIGKPEVLEREVIQAVDVFALFHDGSPTAFFNRAPTVCLQGNGTLLYLDATAAPRTVAELPVFVQSGYTCGSIPNAGTVVLVGDSPGMIGSASVGATTTLSDCTVTTLDILNLRTQPDIHSPVVRMIPYNVTLTAFERSADWFYVDYLGSRGWVSASFVSPQGTCH